MRKWLLAAGFAALSTVSAHALDLVIWQPTPMSPNSGLPAMADSYKDLYARFEAENPDIKIKFEILPGGTEALTQILTAASAGNLPDVAFLDGFWIARLVDTGKLQPLNDFWDQASRDTLYKAAVDAVTFDGKVYAAWFYNAWRGLFYRKDVLAELGYDAPPKTWDEFLEVAEKAKAKGVNLVMFPGSATELTALHMLSMYWGLGGELVDDTGKPIFFEGENRAALEKLYGMYRELVEKGYMPVDVSTMDETATRPFFYSGETLTVAQSSSQVVQMYTDVPDIKGNLGAFNYPLPDGKESTPILTGWTLGMFATDPERQAAAWKFMAFMLKPDNLGKLNAAAGHLPIIQSIWDQDFYKNDALMQQFKGIFDSGGMRPRPPVAIYPAITNAWATQMADVLAGNITPAQAVDNARDQVMAEYDRLSTR